VAKGVVGDGRADEVGYPIGVLRIVRVYQGGRGKSRKALE
jgi:hypothetical protein